MEVVRQLVKVSACLISSIRPILSFPGPAMFLSLSFLTIQNLREGSRPFGTAGLIVLQ
jgi:hypothetical protein